MPLLHGGAPAWRRCVFSEYDYSLSQTAVRLGIAPKDARLFMAADERWKFIHAPGFRPMLFDMQADPNEFRDLGGNPAYAAECGRWSGIVAQWGLRMSQRTTLSEAQILGRRGKVERKGILIGVWDEAELPDEIWSGYLPDRK
jgi:hypothetical protein